MSSKRGSRGTSTPWAPSRSARSSVAAHPYDLAAAAEQGMRTAFVRRPQEWGTGKAEAPTFPVDITAEDFIDLATQLGV